MKKFIILAGLIIYLIIIFNKSLIKNVEVTQKPPITTYNCIEEINTNNSNINSIECDLKLNGKINATLFYSKPKNLRIEATLIGPELDIGSNKDEFWFWSKRSDPPYLYFAKYENLYNTKLKTPLHPLWIMETLSMNSINEKCFQYGNFLAILEERKNLSNKTVFKLTLVDPKLKAVIGHYLYYPNGYLIISSEITRHHNINGIMIPQTIETKWYEENLNLTWEIENPKINAKIDPTKWVRPNMKNQKELGITFGV